MVFDETLPPSDGQEHADDSFRGGRERRFGDFELLGVLGQGGMGTVYRAYDRRRGQVVALKTIERVDPSALYRFKQEFRALADIAHPNLVTLFELASHGQDWFFTMELVEGSNFLTQLRSCVDLPEAETDLNPASRDLRSSPADIAVSATADYIASSRPVTANAGSSSQIRQGKGLSLFQLGRLRSALRQLAEGLAALHATGKLHRDIKPSNVIVTATGRVVIVDFGLAAELGLGGLHESTEPHILGTAAYMAPEQAAGSAVSPAGDWYSVGVVTYEALTGRLPFLGRPLEVLMEKQRFEPPSPRELVSDLPDDLSTLCVDLLRRHPEARPSGHEVLRRLGSLPTTPSAPTSLQSSPRRAIPLVGRERHLAALHDAFSAVARGQPVVLHVHGHSGAGKSALVQRFLADLAEQDEAVVLAGRCYQHESVPYKALDSLIDALSRYLKRLQDAEVRALLPRDVHSLSRVFPVLRRVETVATAPGRGTDISELQELRRRAFGALRELLARLGDRKPLVLFVDDLQWGDVDSAALISEILRPPDPPLLLMLGAYRSEDAAVSPFLREILGSRESAGPSLDRREVTVASLTQQEAESLATILLGDDNPALSTSTAAIARESGGNPYLIAELVRYGQSSAEPSDGLSPGEEITLDRVLWARILRLPEEARRLLEIIAVSGRPLPHEDACRAAGAEADGWGALAVLRSGRLVRGTGSADREVIETYHDRIRETVVAHLASATLAHHHQRLAHVLQASGQGDPEVLAFHFHEAGETRAAGEYYKLAAHRAVQSLAFERAASLYRRALDLGSTCDRNRRALRIHLADALANAGRGAEAAAKYLEAAEGALESESLDLRGRAATQLLISGHIDEGLVALRDLLRAVGIGFTRTPRQALASLVWHRALLSLRGVAFRAREPSAISREDLARIDICWSAAIGLTGTDVIRGADFQTRGFLMALRAGDPFRFARTLVAEAGHASLTGRSGLRRATNLLRRARRVVEQLNHPYTTGMLWLAEGIAAYCDSDFRRALERFDRSAEHFRDHCPAAWWEIDSVRVLALFSLAYMGEMAELIRRRPALVRDAQDRGDLYAEANLITYCLPLVRLAANELDEADEELSQIMARWSQQGFHFQHHNALFARVMIALYRSRGVGPCAWELIRDEWTDLRSAHLLRILSVRVDIFQSRGRAAIAAALSSADPRSLLRVAEADARRLERERLPLPAALAQTVRAGVAGARGNSEAARVHLISAADRFNVLNMRLWEWACRRRLGSLIGGPEGQDLTSQADAWMCTQAIQDPARMAAMLCPGFPD
jgi:serine/threonine protein kinase